MPNAYCQRPCEGRTGIQVATGERARRAASRSACDTATACGGRPKSSSISVAEPGTDGVAGDDIGLGSHPWVTC
jgi:hypothetical protein